MKRVLTDYRISEKSEIALSRLGYAVIKTYECSAVQKPVCGHPDMMLCKLSDYDYVAEAGFSIFFKAHFPDRNIIAGTSRLSDKYPLDIAFNCARVGDCLFCNASYTDKAILEYCEKNGIKIINIRQGYAKCSICVVADNAIITADRGVFNKARENGIDALLTENRGIVLDGFNEGFIGGATGLLEKDLLAVNGNLDLHKDRDAIRLFCKSHGVEVISLSDEPITDIGTIIRI